MADDPPERASLERLLGELRPRLHRYCARMTGSVIDGEDVVQEALVNAVDAFPRSGWPANPEGWLFRIAHNAALDFLRRQRRDRSTRSDEDPDMLPASHDPAQDREVAATSLRTFMRLPAAQRSAVILSDVLGHSLEEVCGITDTTLAGAKSALQRGRLRLRELAQEPEDIRLPVLAQAEQLRLTRYVECFNNRDFDAVRRMLADDVELDLVNRLRRSGRGGVGEYLHRYSQVEQWHFAAGSVDGRPAMLVFDRWAAGERPAYFVLLDWAHDQIAFIRDFLFARYVLDGAELLLIDGAPATWRA